MGKVLDKIFDRMRLTDDDYDDDYDDYDDYDEFGDDYDDVPAPVVKKKSFKAEQAPKQQEKEKSTSKAAKSPMSEKTAKTNKKTASPESRMESRTPSEPVSKSTSKQSNKIVPIKAAQSRSMEVCVLRPTTFNDSQEVCNILLSGKAVVLNMEGIEIDQAQRIVDFISGACYAMQGHVEMISNYIFIITPNSIDISGDLSGNIQGAISSGLTIPSFKLNI